MNSKTPFNTPRVLLVEDSLPIRERMRALIEEAGPVTVVGEAESVALARLLFHQHVPDAVVLDLQLADDTSYQLLEEIKRSHPNCVVNWTVCSRYSSHGAAMYSAYASSIPVDVLASSSSPSSTDASARSA